MIERADLRYFSQSELWKPPVDEQVAVAGDLIALIPEDVRTILDAGCGNGAVTNRLVDRWKVLGCDLSEAALQHVLAPTLVVDLAAIPLEDQSFDLVLASDVIEHLPDSIYDRALAELARVARRYVLVAVPHEELLQAAEITCPGCGHRYHAHLHQRSYSIADMSNLLGPEFCVRAIQLSGERWTHRDHSLLNARQLLTGLDYPFEDAVCSECGTRRGLVLQSADALSVSRRFDALQAMLSAGGLLPTPHRSEVLVLFERGSHSEVAPLDISHAILLPGLIEVGALKCVPNPITYPDYPLRIDSTDDNLILALPRSPVRMQIERGVLETIEVYDFIRQSYSMGKSVGANAFNLPRVPFGPHGCFVRIMGASPDLVCSIDYVEGDIRDEIVAICFGDDPSILSLSERLTDALQLTDELEAKREQLERQLQARDIAIGDAHAAANNANDLANRIEVQRDLLNRENLALRQQIGALSKRMADSLQLNDEHTLNLKALEISVGSASNMTAPREMAKAVLVMSHMYPRDYHPAGGIFVHEQVKALRATGVDARVLSGEPYWINTLNPLSIFKAIRNWFYLEDPHWDVFDGVPVIRFPYIVSSRFLPFQAHAFTYTFGATRCLSSIRQTFNFQLVHAHTSYTDGSAGAKVAALYGVPLVITEHTGPFNTLTRTPYLRRKTAAAINSADSLITVSQALLGDIKDQVAMKHYDRSRVLPNVVDTKVFVAAPRESDGRIRALWVGHFVPVKRVDVLLGALALAVQTEPRLCLRLVGSGELETHLRQMVLSLGLEDNVEFAGSADRSTLVTHYRDCDFLVISSESETFGVVAIEAMSCGRPVLTTDCGGPTEVVTHHSLGLVVDKSAVAMAKGMISMASRREEFDPRLLRKVAIQRYSTVAVASALTTLYSKLL